ncbi:MAG: hypothetical protein ACWGQW_15160 [bacterium]
MANALYDYGREGFLAGDIDWDANTIRAVLIDTGTYTVDLANHQDYADISGVVGTESAAFTAKTTTAGVADAADITFTSVSGATVEAIIIFQDTGTPATDRLIAYIDTGTGLPVTPNGGDITVAWSDGANKIFKL